jgi:hypothetical protein
MLDLQTRADFLKSAIGEDRQELRILKDRIYQVAILVAVSAFGVTAFALQSSWGHRRFLVGTDAAFVLLLWAAFLPLKRDLDGARRCLEAREDMIGMLGDPQDAPFQPFPVVPMDRPIRVKENGVYWLIGMVTLVLLSKLAVMASLVP